MSRRHRALEGLVRPFDRLAAATAGVRFRSSTPSDPVEPYPGGSITSDVIECFFRIAANPVAVAKLSAHPVTQIAIGLNPRVETVVKKPRINIYGPDR